MAKLDETYVFVDVESYRPKQTGRLYGKIHIRPCSGQGHPIDMHVECSKNLSKNYPVGSKFRVKAKLTDRKGEGEFLYSYFGSEYEVLAKGDKE